MAGPGSGMVSVSFFLFSTRLVTLLIASRTSFDPDPEERCSPRLRFANLNYKSPLNYLEINGIKPVQWSSILLPPLWSWNYDRFDLR